MITWITALCNLMKLLAMPCRVTKDRWAMVASPDKTWSTGEGNGKPLQHICLENPMNSMKRQKYVTLKDEAPRSVGLQNTPGEEQINSSRRNERLSESRNNIQLWMCLVMKVKSDAIKNNIA